MTSKSANASGASSSGGVLQSIASRVRQNPTLGRVALLSIPDFSKKIRIEPIGPFYIRLRRHRSYWLRDPLTHERTMFGALQQMTTQGDVVWDVGANIGLYTRFFAQVFGAASVVAFEPMTENQTLLKRNIEVGGIGARVTHLPYALFDRSGPATLQVDTAQSGSAALDDVTGGRPSAGHEQYGLSGKTETVEMRTGDELIVSSQAPAPAVVKIDIEGAEAGCLRGMQQTLAEHRPRLAIELHELETSRDVLQILDSAGYISRAFLRRDGVRRWERVTPGSIATLSNTYDLHHVFAEHADTEQLLETEPARYER